ncbi:MAG: triose-phosphate isomerase [Deltaproteobacteria bacterium]|nr:triose-phosphate isomerase [Deltaproteobacteria bacterium]
MTQTRARILAGNWKMHLAPGEALEYFGSLDKSLASQPLNPGVRRVIFPPAYCLGADVQRAAASAKVELGAQNVHWEEKGAFTGELAAPALLNIGIRWALVGHSERRQYFGETDETAAKRFKRAATSGMNVMYCIGERLTEREAGQTYDVLTRQLTPFLGVLRELLDKPGTQWPDTELWCLAYEPVWAIGTGKTATNVEAEDAHKHIRKVVWDQLGMQVAQKISILYGGSVTPENVSGLMTQPNVDGALVGGASLKPDGFAKILSSA